MSKIIEFGPEGREKLVKGINTLADAVVSTLGPNGRNVVIEKEHGQVQSTKDGVTVAKHISLKDPVENLGVNLVKDASLKTADKAGDGTTTSTLLAREMIKGGLSHLNNGANAVEIKREIDSSVKEVIQSLKSKISEDISSEDQLEQVATVSANNDKEIGKLIATALDKVGDEGIVHIEESKSGETYLETVEGLQFDRGFKSPYFVTDNNTMTSTLTDVSVLIADHKFTNVKELLPILEGVAKQAKSLLIIAEDIDHEALATLIVNKQRGTLDVCAVKAPDFGDRRKLILEDIAIMTGGQVFDKSKGMKLDKFSWEWFGEARTATISKTTTTIIDGKGDEDTINKRIEELAHQVEGSESEFEREQLQSRLAKMCGGVSNTRRVISRKETEYLDALVRGAYARHDLEVGHVITKETFENDFYLAVPLHKGQLSCREIMDGEKLINSVKADEKLTIDDIDGPYRDNENLSNLIKNRGL